MNSIKSAHTLSTSDIKTLEGILDRKIAQITMNQSTTVDEAQYRAIQNELEFFITLVTIDNNQSLKFPELS